MHELSDVAEGVKRQVDLAMIEVLEKRQRLGAYSTAFLALLVSLSMFDGENVYEVFGWMLLVFAASGYKYYASRYGEVKTLGEATRSSHVALLTLSAAATGALWSIPLMLLDIRNSIELATVVLVTSGIIAGSVSTYLGIMRYILLVATAPCASIVLALAVKLEPLPYAAIASIAIFYLFILMLSKKTYVDALQLYQIRFENLDLIDNLKQSRDILQSLANKDDLTGLPNRRLLYDLFEKYSVISRRNNKKLAVLFIDMNKFKAINDRYGHEVGDKVLIAAGRIMQETLRHSDIVARLGGDEFVAVITDAAGHAEAMVVAQKLRANLGARLRIDGVEVETGASIGVAMYPDHSLSLDELLKIADASMYSDKSIARAITAEP